MIQANELRIGNWVRCWGQPYLIILVSMGELRLDWHYPDNIVEKDDINGIPLTPEILEKAGLKIIAENPYFSDTLLYELDNRFQFTFLKGSGLLFLPHGKAIINRWLQNLHQLQNLYFALTEEELKVNLHVEVTN